MDILAAARQGVRGLLAAAVAIVLLAAEAGIDVHLAPILGQLQQSGIVSKETSCDTNTP